MWNSIFEIALSNGIFAALFVALLVYVLKDSRVREKKYQKTIERLSGHLDIVDNIKTTVEDIKEEIKSVKNDISLNDSKTRTKEAARNGTKTKNKLETA